MSWVLSQDLGGLEVEQWPLVLKLSWDLGASEAFKVSSIGSQEQAAVLTGLVNVLLDDLSLPWPADSLVDGSALPDGASVGALGVLSDDSGASHVTLPGALGELVISVDEGGAGLTLSLELLELSGSLEFEGWPLESLVELELLAEDASVPLSLSLLVDDAAEAVVAVSLDDLLLSWPASGSGLVLLLPESALVVSLLEVSDDLGALPETWPAALDELVVSSCVGQAVLALSHESLDHSGTLEVESSSWSKGPWLGASDPLSSWDRHQTAVLALSLEFLDNMWCGSPADGLGDVTLLVNSASLAWLVVSSNEFGSLHLTLPAASGPMVESSGVSRALASLVNELLENLSVNSSS